MKKILVLHGPNLNLLGTREPEIYGKTTLEEINRQIEKNAGSMGVEVKVYQTNREGELIDLLHKHRDWMEGIIINPAAYSHTSLAVYDALMAVNRPAVEVHLTNLAKRGHVRSRSVTAAACVGIISGFGPASYMLALQYLAAL
ncbi:MAG: type II 3-dehydroquinate dehydratase [bacterium]